MSDEQAQELTVRMGLCLGERVVPVKTHTLPFVDPSDQADEADEELAVSLVSFKVTSHMVWVESACKLKSKVVAEQQPPHPFAHRGPGYDQ